MQTEWTIIGLRTTYAWSGHVRLSLTTLILKHLYFSTQVLAQHLLIISEISNYFIDVWKLPFLVDIHCFLVRIMCGCISQLNRLFALLFFVSMLNFLPCLFFPSVLDWLTSQSSINPQAANFSCERLPWVGRDEQ